jgi:transposase
MIYPRVAEVLGVSQRAIHDWVRRYRDVGLPGLAAIRK